MEKQTFHLRPTKNDEFILEIGEGKVTMRFPDLHKAMDYVDTLPGGKGGTLILYDLKGLPRITSPL